MFIPSLFAIYFLFSQVFSASGFSCLNEEGIESCEHSYDDSQNEITCAIWWSYTSEDGYRARQFVLPPKGNACWSDLDIQSTYHTTDFDFSQRCYLQNNLPLTGVCLCRNEDQCNRALMGMTSELNGMIDALL